MLGGRVARRSHRRASPHLCPVPHLLLSLHRRVRYLMMSANDENGGGLNRRRTTCFAADDTMVNAKTRGKRVFCRCPADRDMTNNFGMNERSGKEGDGEEEGGPLVQATATHTHTLAHTKMTVRERE